MATESTQQGLVEVVDNWRGRGVLVVGDAMVDEWRFAESHRLCREAPAPVLKLRRRQISAGGAANTAVNLAALGARVTLVAPVGADVAGDELHDCLDRAGVLDRTVTQPEWATPVKRRLLAADQILVREDEGNGDGRLSDAGVGELLNALGVATEELRGPIGPVLVVCDYGLGALPAPVRTWLLTYRRLFATVALDAHDLTPWHGLRPTVVTPSFTEATRLLADRPEPATTDAGRPKAGGRIAGPTSRPAGRAVDPPGAHAGRAVDPPGAHADRAAHAQARLADLRDRTGADVVAVTLDVDGTVVAAADGARHRSHANPVPASHAVGAGDAYLAAMTLGLAAGADVSAAARLAQIAATATVSGTGTCVCDRQTLLAALGTLTGEATSAAAASPAPQNPPTAPGTVADRAPGVVDAPTLAATLLRHRRDGRRIVFTNGCFDVLHRGHVRYLEQARRLGDLLVVAVNSDDSVRRLKGPGRPVNPVEDRVDVLAALSCVDYVVVFGEDSPSHLIEAVRPEVYVKGGDYPPEMVPEAPLVRRLGGQVHTLGYVPDRSTSAIIERIRAHGMERTPATPGTDNRGPFLSERP